MLRTHIDGSAARLNTALLCVGILVLAPVLVRAPLLLGLLIADPTLLYGGIADGLRAGPLGGFPPLPTIDPNIAFTSHALGHRAALDVLSGHIPWWNHFEGVGTPLVGEMQAAALFPLTWLLVLKNGQLYMHIALQIISGLSTWALLRKIGCSRLAAVAAALAFEFNGTNAWLANAVINPIPFLPLTLLGIEMLHERVARAKAGGHALLAIGLAASLYAGFPEVAYLNGLLILVWTLVRTAALPHADRWIFLRRVVIGGIAALAISAPVLVPFFDYLPLANTGGHEGTGFESIHLSPGFLVGILAPYAFGGIFQFPEYEGFWGAVGGYAGCVLVALAVAGATGRTHRGLRIALVVWVFVTIGISYGFPGSSLVVKIVPGLKLAAYFRYLPPSWEFSLCVLAGFALTDLSRETESRAFKIAVVLVALMVIAAIWTTRRHDMSLHGRFALGNAIFVAITLLAMAAFAWRTRTSETRRRAMAALLALEAVVYFAIPTLSNPSRGTVVLDGVYFLQKNLGLQRFVTLGPVQPNYGSYFGIASINHNDLPIPRSWTDYVERHLDSNAPPILFTGGSRQDPAGPSAADQLIANLDAYRRVGVRYVLAPKDALGLPPFASLAHYVDATPDAKLKEVFGDRVMRVFELASPAPYFSAPGCTLVAHTRNDISADCNAASTLTRLELFMQGWRATVDNEATPIGQTSEIFQRVALPAGRSTVHFEFVPPFMNWAWAAFVAGWMLVALNFAGPFTARRARAAP
ncbi:Bacterial membrane protein YfhO [Caballeronia pedi]|uniref:Bacterial membrane protein YfhO n=1 Tax=Caballeronia pedi TaxID=1777141 RepID=A0A158BZB2_9BURK|nr:YfhO family protein [Caballeronia pedi]SAK74617.1 Bacterial membrane protein YfhO [Caballeronia pedi]